MSCTPRLLATLACAAACCAAQADRSRLDEDAEGVEAGDCEIETAFERHEQRGEAPGREASIQLGCGIGWNTELTASVARGRSEEARIEAIGIEVRTLLRGREPGRIGWALIVGLDGERGDGRRWHRDQQFVAIEATCQPDPAWLVEATLGTSRDPSERRGRTWWSLASEHAISETVELRAELTDDDRSRPLYALALRLRGDGRLEDATLTLGVGARAGPQRERRGGLALGFEF